MFKKLLFFFLLLAACSGLWREAQAQQRAYYVYVAAESEDEVDLVRFDGRQAEVVKRIPVGVWPTEIEGPHGLTVSPDGNHWFVSIAHGLPFGKLVKYRTGTDERVGEVELGLFPASMHVSPATGLVYVVNFNLHGKHEPSSVSVVEPETMTEVARTTTGVMPHGSRLSPDGLRQYSVAMMDGTLFEMDARTFEVTRTLNTAAGTPRVGGLHAHMDTTAAAMPQGDKPPRPTWVQPHPTKPLAYVANNGIDEIVEVDLQAWQVTRRFKTGPGPYNLDVTPDGRYLLFTEKKAGSTGVIDLERGEQVVSIPNSRKVSHGVAIAPDGRYAFISVEGIGGEPGSVDVIDLQTMERVATVDVGKQAGGIAFWKIGS